MSPNRIFGSALVVSGVILLYFGLQATDSLSESITEGFTGKYTETTTWYIVGGAVAIIAGAMLAYSGTRRRQA